MCRFGVGLPYKTQHGEPNTNYTENKGNNGRENVIKSLNISLL